MKLRPAIILLLLISFSVKAQYYYKDIVTPGQTMDLLSKYREQRIGSVKMISYEGDGERAEDFSGSQTISDNFTTTKTLFHTLTAGLSELTVYFNAAGRLLKSFDTTDGSGSVTEYKYNEKGQIIKIVNVSTSAGSHQEKEEHVWFYDAENRPRKMMRIKNDIDTLFVSFVLDENGNVAEENSIRKKTEQPSFYYYYDEKKRMTDIVTYSQKAQRLLPIYIFEYNAGGRISAMIVVPEGSDDYQKWYYEYNEAGLKSKETAYNKRRKLLGRVDYEYRK